MPIEYYKIDKSKSMDMMKSAPSTAMGLEPMWDAQTSDQFPSEKGCIDLAYGFSICWELDLANLVLIITLKFNGMEVGRWRLDRNNTSIHIGVDVKVAKASLDLTVDWNERKITLKGEVCAMGFCKRFDVIIFKW